jgi:hypothetical protein
MLVLGIGITENKNDCLLRFEYFCKKNNLDYEIVGYGKKWLGGNMADGPGGGQKLIELRDHLINNTNDNNVDNNSDNDNDIVIVCDTFDLIIISNKNEIMKKYRELCPNREVLFSSEVYCWPDKTLAPKYPTATSNNKYKYLNSGGFMGHRHHIIKLLDKANIGISDDDQLFFTLKYLAKSSVTITIDTQCKIFQSLNGATSDVCIKNSRIFNNYTNEYPVLIHGNGPAKKFLNYSEGYLDRITPNLIDYSFFIAIFFDCISSTHNYLISLLKNLLSDTNSCTKKNIVIYYYNSANYSFTNISTIHTICSDYNIICKKYIINDDILTDFHRSQCDYFLYLNKFVKLDDNFLQNVKKNLGESRNVFVPMMLHCKNKYEANFWSDTTDDNMWSRSVNYLDIITRKNTGLFNVVNANYCFILSKLATKDFASLDNIYKSFTAMKHMNYNIYLDNTVYYGEFNY